MPHGLGHIERHGRSASGAPAAAGTEKADNVLFVEKSSRRGAYCAHRINILQAHHGMAGHRSTRLGGVPGETLLETPAEAGATPTEARATRPARRASDSAHVNICGQIIFLYILVSYANQVFAN